MPNQIQDLFGKWIQFDCPTDGARFSIAVANRVWDPGSLSWVSETQPAGGGGGPATIADGADVTQGAIADAAVVADSNGTVSAKLRGLVKIAANGYGTWNYAANTLNNTGSVTGSGKCIGIRVFAAGTDSEFNINGGDTIKVRGGAGVDVNPGGNITAPTVNWVSGTIDIVIEGLT